MATDGHGDEQAAPFPRADPGSATSQQIQSSAMPCPLSRSGWLTKILRIMNYKPAGSSHFEACCFDEAPGAYTPRHVDGILKGVVKAFLLDEQQG